MAAALIAISAASALFQVHQSRKKGASPSAPAPTSPRTAPAGAPTETATPRIAPAPVPGTPTPPDAVKAASANTKAAGLAGQRARKRAAAGSAGRVRLGTPSILQQAIRASSTPATLLGS